MNCTLTFEYAFSTDDDDFGWLSARLHTPDFSGRNGMWVQWQDLLDLARSLSRYPIEAGQPVTCEWGFSEKEEYILITKLDIGPAGATGGLLAEICLRDYNAPANYCQTQFRTDYPALDAFREQIEAMMRKEASSATLNGFSAR